MSERGEKKEDEATKSMGGMHRSKAYESLRQSPRRFSLPSFFIIRLAFYKFRLVSPPTETVSKASTATSDRQENELFRMMKLVLFKRAKLETQRKHRPEKLFRSVHLLNQKVLI